MRQPACTYKTIGAHFNGSELGHLLLCICNRVYVLLPQYKLPNIKMPQYQNAAISKCRNIKMPQYQNAAISKCRNIKMLQYQNAAIQVAEYQNADK
jgi:hypothetical protein